MKKSEYPKIKHLDGFLYQSAFQAGCQEVIAHEKELNRINVFPVPDKDTGANLKKTFSPLLERFPLSSLSLGQSCQEIAETATSSALGYSGIIFAQFFSGFIEKLKESEKASTKEFAQASTQAVARAYGALSNPQEGTVLTVMKEWAEELNRLAATINDFRILLCESLKTATRALEETPKKLEVLAKNKVVDAGGKAFVYFLEGFIHSLEKPKHLPTPMEEKEIHVSMQKRRYEEERFCAECCVRKKNLDRRALIQGLNSLGRDLIFYGSINFAKIHLKTYQPEEVFFYAKQFGHVSSPRIFEFSPEMPASKKKSLALVSDTTCDISDEYIEKNDLYFIPVKFQTRDKIFIDKVDVIPEEFYPILSSSPVVPKTSQPSLKDFTQFFEHLLAHYRSLISLQLSGKLSGTFQTSLQAAHKIAPDRIRVLNGKNISVGLGLAMVEGIKAANQGLDYEGVLERMKMAVEGVEIFIGLPTLKYLVKGGRVNKAKGMVAKMLNINPILSVDQEGDLVPIGKTRGKKKLAQKIVNIALEKMAEVTPEDKMEFLTAVAHTDAPHLGEEIAKSIKERLGKEVVMVMNASPVLGVHAGPGVVGIAFMKSVKQEKV